MKLDLSVLVVTYGNPETVARFHGQLGASLTPHANWEVLYYDNSPDQAVADRLAQKGVSDNCLFRNPDNPGFAFGVNRLLEKARYRHIALVNPDVSGFTAGFWSDLIEASCPGQARFIRLVDAEGRIQDCVGRTPSLRRALTSRIDHDAVERPQAVENGIMAFMLSDRATFDRVGPLDERFRLYAEDTDWCLRAGRCGIELIFDPRFELTHLGGQSADTVMSRRQQLKAKYEAERLFIQKHFRGPHRLAMLILNWFKLLRCR